jgi:hypothetical protein
MLQDPEAEFSLSLRVIPSLAAPELQDMPALPYPIQEA